ncbi:MAG: acyltransferase family protein [Butyrivibrio sp.]
MEFKLLSMIGMMLVLCGHYSSKFLTMDGTFNYSTFHIPMFLFISGYFYSEEYAQSPQNLWLFSKKKIVHLMIPYFIWNIVYFIFAFCLQKFTSFNIYNFETFSWKTLLIRPFQLSDGAGYNVAAWFLMALFLCQLFYNAIIFLLKKIPKIQDIGGIALILFSAIAYFSVCLAQSDWNSDWKITICRTGYLVFYYNLGYIYKKYLEKYDNKINDIVVIAVCIVINFLMINNWEDYGSSCYYMIFNNSVSVFYYMCRAIVGIYFWLRVAK